MQVISYVVEFNCYSVKKQLLREEVEKKRNVCKEVFLFGKISIKIRVSGRK